MEEQTISFNVKDLKGIQQPHYNPLMVTVTIRNYKTSRVLIDNDSSTNILFSGAFHQMGIPRTSYK